MDPFIGEIRGFAFTYAPMGWATCDGQVLPITQYSALFALIGPTFGGDGRTTFALPNLQGRAALDVGAGPGLTPRTWGSTIGGATVALTADNYPPHTHALNVVANVNANQTIVANNYLSRGGNAGRQFIPTNTYQAQPSAGTQLAADAVQQAGTATGSVPHDNMQPYLPVLMCIALTGIWPPRP